MPKLCSADIIVVVQYADEITSSLSNQWDAGSFGLWQFADPPKS